LSFFEFSTFEFSTRFSGFARRVAELPTSAVCRSGGGATADLPIPRGELSDIPEALDRIARAVSGKTEAEFIADETVCYAVAQKLTIIGEAVARLSSELRARHVSVPWQAILTAEAL
jgi:hypothetical protein